MNAKQITFQVLDSLSVRDFTGAYLSGLVCGIEGNMHYPDTILRYMREWRKVRSSDIVLVDKKRSLYRKILR